jgi:ABC-2 type transport system ATP-binding protein
LKQTNFYLRLNKYKAVSIKVEDISKFYGTQEALSHINFEAKKGEIIGFLGPNGAGKSTLMKILTGYIATSSGKASIANFDIEEDSIEVKKRIGYLPEHNSLYTDMYIKEYLSFVAGIYKVPNKKARVEEMIKLVKLDIEQHKKIEELSKGYRQRVGLAAAMIHDPEVLILDEPTTGLDPNQLSEIRKLIMSIGKEKTVLLSTHVMQEVEAMCSRVLIINKGKIIADKPTNELKRSIVEQDLIEIEFDKLIDEAKFALVFPNTEIEHLGNNKYRLLNKSGLDIRADLFDWAVKNNISILGQKIIESNLEDVFKLLTNSKESTQ